MLVNKSSVWTHDETVSHVRNVNRNKPQKLSLWLGRKVAANTNISMRLTVPDRLKLHLIPCAIGCSALDVLQAIVYLPVALNTLRKLGVAPSAELG